MEIILVLIPVSLVIVAIAVAAFFWAVDNNQYEDVERSGSDALFGEDEKPAAPQRDGVSKPTVT
jgi:cbb3-type cytochrome oxidase maturation protein